MRPWKAEQLGGGYAVSSWVERTSYLGAGAVIAVSAAMRDDVLRLLPRRRPRPGARRAQRHRHRRVVPASPTPTGSASSASTPTGPSVVFVGRITRQKGLPLFLRAAAELPPRGAARAVRRRPRHPGDRGRGGRRWSRSWPRPAPGWSGSARCCRAHDVVALLTARDGVRLPVDLRAAGHREPRGDGLRDRGRGHRHRRHPRGRRATATTGRLVPIEQATDGTGTPLDPERYVADFAARPQRGGRRPRPGAPRWGAPAGSARSTPSAGARSPSRPWGSTGPSWPESRRGSSHSPGTRPASRTGVDLARGGPSVAGTAPRREDQR